MKTPSVETCSSEADGVLFNEGYKLQNPNDTDNNDTAGECCVHIQHSQSRGQSSCWSIPSKRVDTRHMIQSWKVDTVLSSKKSIS